MKLFSKYPHLTKYLVVLTAFTAVITLFYLSQNKKTQVQLLSTQASAQESSENAPLDEITVEVSGAVENPGVYTLAGDARIYDLLLKGGQILNSASADWVAKNLNLALPLSDAQKIYVPFASDLEDAQIVGINVEFLEPFSAALETPTTAKTSTKAINDVQTDPTAININTASLEQLDELPGIGPAYAQKILDGIPYTDLADFEERSQVPANTIEGFKAQISF